MNYNLQTLFEKRLLTPKDIKEMTKGELEYAKRNIAIGTVDYKRIQLEIEKRELNSLKNDFPHTYELVMRAKERRAKKCL